MKKTLLMSFVGLLVSLTTMAQLPKAGKYYRIVNQNPDKSVTSSGVRYGYAITEDLNSNALTADQQGNDTQYNQLWSYSGGKLQNAQTQRYLGTLYTSQQAYTDATGASVSFEPASGGSYLIICGQPAHADGSNKIVGWWDKTNSNSYWKFEEVAVDEAALKAAQADYALTLSEKASLMQIVNKASAIAPVVEGYFQDKACTTLKSEFAAMGDEDFKARMTADELPEQVQTMVLNIKNKWAGEFNPAMSARFRVQDYKIFTRCDDAGNAGASPKDKWRSTQMADRNDPTGIWTDARQLLYVFVESEIPEGASLKIGQASGSGVIGLFAHSGNNITLHQGMNIIYCGLNNTTQWIMYTCAADYSKPLSSYPDMKIHIEGGEVMGYVTKTPGDEEATNADYAQVMGNAVSLMRAKGKDMSTINFSVRGERGLFEFPLETFRQIWSTDSDARYRYGYKIYKSINFYDNVLKWEWSNMGWQDRVENGEADNELENLIPGGGDAVYPTYVNNVAPTMQCPDNKNPHSGNSYTGMPGVGAVESSYNAERADFDIWCCAHESGHNNQHTINLPSSKESSNNYFSNIVTNQYGYRMSRGWSFAENYDAYVAKKIVFPQRDISITLRMYYNLWLYYHQAGKNKQFSPKLFKLLREDPMYFGGEGWYTGANGGADRGSATTSWLKFYEKVCEAAGEDLTEYFRLWGFLTPTSEAGGDYIELIDGKYYAYCGDYSSYYVRCEQKDIDAAIARVKAKGYPENLQIMFIEDRQILRQRHDPWAQPGDMKPYNNGWMGTQADLNNDYGNVGDVLTFIDGSANTSNYTYILSGNKLKLTGTGGAGFIVYDKDGNIAYMSNRFEFEIPAELAVAGFTIKTINADGTTSEVADKAESATPAEKLEILQKALELAGEYTALEDPTGKKVGLYSSDVIAPLKALVAEANGIISNKEEDSYLTLADKLNTEVLRLKAEDPSQKLTANGLYTITSVRKVGGSSRYLAASGSNVSGSTSVGAASKWAFVAANDKNDGTYYLQNNSNKRLMGATFNEKGKVNGVNMGGELPATAAVLKVEHLGMGTFTLRPKDETNVNIDPSGNVTVWGAADEGSQWTIELADEVETVTDEMINEKLAQSRAVLSDVCEVTVDRTPYTLQVTDAANAGYLSTNQPSTTNPLSYAIDNSLVTYFMSNRINNNATEPHHLKIDLGDGVKTKNVQFDILGRASVNYAKGIIVYGSNNGNNWTKVAVINGKDMNIQSPIVRSTTSYRYWRLDVTATAGKFADESDYPWFAVADFKMYDAVENVELKAPYTGISKSLVNVLVKRVDEADGQLGYTFRTPLTDWLVYDALVKAYDNLYKKASAIDPTVNIDGIEADNTADGAIYDLSGRKVSKAGKGIYIVNGKKVLR